MALISSNGPIDYNSLTQAPDFVQSLGEGFQVGNAIKQAQLQSQQQQQALQQQQQYKTDLQQAFSNPTPQAFATLTAKYPQQREAFKQSWDMLDTDQKQTQFSDGTKVFAALQNGQPDVALQQVDRHIQAAQNAGQDVSDLQATKQLIQNDPKSAQAHIGLVLSSIDPDKWGKIATEMRSSQQAPYQQAKLQGESQVAQAQGSNASTAQNLDNQSKQANIAGVYDLIGNRAASLNLDRDKLTSDVQMKLADLNQKNNTLDGEAKTLMNGAVVNSTAANASAQQQRDLAQRLENTSGEYTGFAGTAAEKYKSLTGNQDAISGLRAEYARIRNNQAIKNLPPGSASDADVSMALQGFPPDTANTAQLAQFLRGMAKLNDITAVGEAAKADWVNSVGSLGKPKTDINVGGTLVPAGTSYTDFVKQYVPKKAAQSGATQDQAQIPNRSYMRFATPGAQ